MMWCMSWGSFKNTCNKCIYDEISFIHTFIKFNRSDRIKTIENLTLFSWSMDFCKDPNFCCLETFLVASIIKVFLWKRYITIRSKHTNVFQEKNREIQFSHWHLKWKEFWGYSVKTIDFRTCSNSYKVFVTPHSLAINFSYKRGPATPLRHTLDRTANTTYQSGPRLFDFFLPMMFLSRISISLFSSIIFSSSAIFGFLWWRGERNWNSLKIIATVTECILLWIFYNK